MSCLIGHLVTWSVIALMAPPDSQPACEPAPPALAKLVAEMEKEVETLRGWKFKHPVEAGVYTVDQLRAFMESFPPDDATAKAMMARNTAAHRLIGLIPPGCDPEKAFTDATSVFVPAIYDHRSGTLGIVKRESELDYDSLSLRVSIVHELTHAMDDQYYDLDSLMESGGGTSDAGAVSGAIIEGAAIVMQTRYEDKAGRTGKFDVAAAKQDTRDEMAQMKTLFESPPYVTTFLARFPCGVRFLARGKPKTAMSTDSDGGVADAVRMASTNVPRSSEQILHPEKYWHDDKRDEPVVVNDEDVEKLLAAEGLQVIYTDTIGELLCAVLAAPDRTVNPMGMAMPGYWTNEGAMGWGGDRLFLLAAEPIAEDEQELAETLYALWLTTWDTPIDRSEFVDDYEAYRAMPARHALKLGKLGAAFLFGFDEAQRQALAARLQNTPPRFTRDGKPWSDGGSEETH